MILKSIIKLNTKFKRLILISLDIFIITVSVWFSFWLRTQNSYIEYLQNSFWILPTTLILGIFIYNVTGYYRGLLTYSGSSFIYKSAIINLLVITVSISFGLLNQLNMPPRSIWIIIYILIFGLNGLIRIFIRDYSRSITISAKKTPHVVIYGAGAAGAQLINSIKTVGNYRIIFIVDDDQRLWRRNINGIKIFSPDYLKNNRSNIDYVLFSIPSMPLFKKKNIIYKIQELGLSVLEVPSLEDIQKGRKKLETLIPVVIDNLLEREAVEPIPELLSKEVNDSIVLITGAGGSIGRELSLQIIKSKPKKIILLDSNERNLFEIINIIKTDSPRFLSYSPILGDCCDEKLISKVIKENKVQLIFHAAAYKHVHIVEQNPIQGLYNNIISSYIICKVSALLKIKKVILISSDKAVRPTNIMGASKRISEILFQAHDHKYENTCFSMVRFGNVLNSSGSVVPLFREQIKRGGPITITHPDVIRYFMTIKEAAQLVIQSSALARGGEVFLLDMGEPVKILNLAKQMISLSGLSLKNNNNNGDIEIIYTGLKTGEKLYEELLINNNSESTAHPLIFKAAEKYINYEKIIPLILNLEKSLVNYDLQNSFTIVKQIVPEWEKSY